MEAVAGAIAGAVVAALIGSVTALVSRSRKYEVMSSLGDVNKRVEAVEKDLLANYVSKQDLSKQIDEMKKDVKTSLVRLTKIQLILARHFGEVDLQGSEDET